MLRGRNQLQLLSADLKELARLPCPRSPASLALDAAGLIWVAGELDRELASYRVEDSGLIETARWAVPGLLGVRSIAAGPPGVIYALEERSGRLLALDSRARGRVIDEAWVGRGAIEVRWVRGFVLANSLLEHSVSVIPSDDSGRLDSERAQRIRHDGPIWSLDAAVDSAGLTLALGGVEDRPLDRRQGFFGFVDSFVFVYRVASGRAQRVAAVNVSDFGVITPKALRISSVVPLSVEATGYAGARRARLRFGDRGSARVETNDLPPGTTAMVHTGKGWVFANPLLDAWLSLSGEQTTRAPLEDPAAPARSEASRLGEALLFTSLMAPQHPSVGALSRNTCETCHFEGGVDGRTHFTGRGAVFATTKPLFGLFENRPYFSRALDRDLAEMVHSEFRVANKGGPTDPWFTLDSSRVPWLGLSQARYGPVQLREAVMTFFSEFSRRTNPRVLGRREFSELESRGAQLFAQRCETCHQARLVADDEESRQRFGDWERFVLSENGPIVWGRSGYEKTGVTPYVHRRGARVPSLRRLEEKQPYFTNGHAKTLDDVLQLARFDSREFLHEAHGAAERAALDAEQRAALKAFLLLL